jgi:hypothetical protein
VFAFLPNAPHVGQKVSDSLKQSRFPRKAPGLGLDADQQSVEVRRDSWNRWYQGNRLGCWRLGQCVDNLGLMPD